MLRTSGGQISVASWQEIENHNEDMTMEMEILSRVETCYAEKFGVPR